MTDLLSIVLPIFLLIGAGYVAGRTGLWKREHNAGLAFFVLNFALPALIIHALTSRAAEHGFSWSFMGAYALGSIAAYAVVLAIFRLVLKRPLSEAALGALGSSSSNSGFIGFPVASLALGDVALAALPMAVLIENILMIPAALVLMEAGLQKGRSIGEVARETARRLSRMPLLIAILLGMVLSVTGLHLPLAVQRAVDMTAAASAPCALFVIGGTLAFLAGGSMRGDVAVIAAGKLVLHPALVALALLLVPGVPGDLVAAGIVLACVPMLTVFPILAARAGMEGVAAAALVATTVAGFLTITVVLAILRAAGLA